MAGLPGIIVHGLCTMAFTSKVAIDRLCGGDPARLKRLRVRFSRPVLPGQSITTKMWAESEQNGRKIYSLRNVQSRRRRGDKGRHRRSRPTRAGRARFASSEKVKITIGLSLSSKRRICRDGAAGGGCAAPVCRRRERKPPSGGVSGERCEFALDCSDDRSDAARCAEIYRDLCVDGRVDIVFGPYSNRLARVAAPIAERAGSFVNHGGAGDDLYERGYRMIVGVLSPAGDYMRGFVRLLTGSSSGASASRSSPPSPNSRARLPPGPSARRRAPRASAAASACASNGTARSIPSHARAAVPGAQAQPCQCTGLARAVTRTTWP